MNDKKTADTFGKEQLKTRLEKDLLQAAKRVRVCLSLSQKQRSEEDWVNETKLLGEGLLTLQRSDDVFSQNFSCLLFWPREERVSEGTEAESAKAQVAPAQATPVQATPALPTCEEASFVLILVAADRLVFSRALESQRSIQFFELKRREKTAYRVASSGLQLSFDVRTLHIECFADEREGDVEAFYQFELEGNTVDASRGHLRLQYEAFDAKDSSFEDAFDRDALMRYFSQSAWQAALSCFTQDAGAL